MSEVKFSKEEMNQVKDIQDSYFNIQNDLGNLSITKLRLHKQLESLDEQEEELNKKFFDNQETELKFLEAVNGKYGQGTLDPKTGVFTPNKTEKTE